MMTMVDLQTLACSLRTMSQKSRTASGQAMLQAVAAWMEGSDICSPPAELWEYADRLCGKTCLDCGRTILSLDSGGICMCGNSLATISVCRTSSTLAAVTADMVATNVGVLVAPVPHSP